ncbi:M13 family metallopeptidase [Occallatibacter savannae]|uniref:M13 family metallopeptidase n=1 Tax=Occallatibacter savannae TaxID=1002691 RepID=UPI000D69F679|nr:M13 family metallopeptidase [Occallatibacter savannae]
MFGFSFRKHSLAACALVLLTVSGLSPAQSSDVKANAQIPGLDKSLIDLKADPCVDFAAYACGHFSQLHPIPSDQSQWDIFALLFENTEMHLRTLLEGVAANDAKRTSNEQKIGDFYASCMDESAINKAGLAPLAPWMNRIASIKSTSELTELLGEMQIMNVPAFFAAGEQQDFADASKQIAVVDQAGLGLPERDYYFRTGADAEKTRKQYVEHLSKVFHLLGDPENEASAEAEKVMELETALAKVSMDITSRRDPKNVYHFVPTKELTTMTPQIDWQRLFAVGGAPTISELNVSNPDFFKGLQSILASTDINTIKAYLRWQLVNSVASTALPKDLDEEHFNFYGHILQGQPEQNARWKRCVQATDGALGEALGEVYVQKYFPPSSKAYTSQMVRDIEDAMDKEIDALDWMAPATKTNAKEKLHKIANKIGYPDKWRDYSKLEVIRGDAMHNALASVEFENRRLLDKIGKPVDRGEFGMSPPTINAYYNPSMNDINFPAGILQSPFYDPAATDAENYGHVGAVVGHELTHGFDDQGAKFDGKGNLADWWTAEDATKFKAMTDCEVKEYGSFTALDDLKLNGSLTVGENTADNGGIRLAYIAFLADAKRKNIDVNAKQDGYTPAQQFFLAFGQNWCSVQRPEVLRLGVQTDPHSPPKFRINGVIQNMPEAGEAFGCKVGQPMRPANACRVW